MFTKIVFVCLLVATIDDSSLISAVPQLNSIGSLMPAGLPDPFKNIDFSAVPQLPSIDQQTIPANATACTCAVFMSGQFKKGSSEQPTGYPALISELEQAYPCNAGGMKMCVNRCLESVGNLIYLRDVIRKIITNYFTFRSSSTCPTLTRLSVAPSTGIVIRNAHICL